MSDNYYPEMQKLTILKDRATYTSDNSGPRACYCTGECDVLGYCPVFSKNESAAEKARRLGTKVIPDVPPSKPENPVIGVCERCRRTIHVRENVICMEHDCPAGISGIANL